MQEVVELGGTLEAEVVALDASGNPLPAHSLMDLQPHPQSTVISARCVGMVHYMTSSMLIEDQGAYSEV